MRYLNFHNDNLVVFTAHSAVPVKAEASGSRVPLQSIPAAQNLPLQVKDEPRDVAGTRLDIGDYVKPERAEEDIVMADVEPAKDDKDLEAEEAKITMMDRLRKIVESGRPEELEAEVKKCQAFLGALKIPFVEKGGQSKDARYFLTQIEPLRTENVDTPTVIGVVGNTGAGKSSIINAMLDEEKLVPTNCMRACTAVVTEMSWNTSDDPNAKYRAKVEFIQASDWEKDLRMSLSDLLDNTGNVSRDCTNAESEAGVAYAKIKAVYPHKTKEELANSTVEDLMNVREVKEVLGQSRDVKTSRPEPFYKQLQRFVDSNEKKREKGEKKAMEFWPLIKVVRIYVKSDALSTGAIIVDLPGVHDSNAARAAVAAGYMKQCTGLWIVAPINRAVDDKAAKSLLGESFKRQLKYDGIYSRITFICSKTDDISTTEAAESLKIDDQLAGEWEKMDEIDAQKKEREKSVAELKISKGVYSDVKEDTENQIEAWEKLKDDLEAGIEVFAPAEKSKKRKRSTEPKKSKKKSKKSAASEDDFIENDDGEASDKDTDDDTGSEGEASGDESESDDKEPLTIEKIEEKMTELKDMKKKARVEILETKTKIDKINKEIKGLEITWGEIDASMRAKCISGRNEYSRGAIQQDFKLGIKELDQEAAQEEDEDNFDPDKDLRDYEEVARSLKVFCCSSRAYQQKSGRLTRDARVPGFRTLEETEIPQLQQHCKYLTEGVRASNCRRFLTDFVTVMTSLSLWASDDGNGLNITDAQRRQDTKFLQTRLATLEKDLDKTVKECLAEMIEALADNIFDSFTDVVKNAASRASPTAQKWHSPINKVDRAAGGYCWATYKAIMRRNGVYSNAQGPHDFNNELCEPITKSLANRWEKAFVERLPRVLSNFTRKAKSLLMSFHQEIFARSQKQGAGVAGLAMLGQQLKNHEATFVNLSSQMLETINALQREANREFTPVIAARLALAYDWNVAEVGPGQFKRMKTYMAEHIENNLDMFGESCGQVKSRLEDMCKTVKRSMADKAEEIFAKMTRDYLQVVSGSQVQGQVMPKLERQMRAEVAQEIENGNKVIAVANPEAEADAEDDSAPANPEVDGIANTGNESVADPESEGVNQSE